MDGNIFIYTWSRVILCNYFFGTGGITTIKHRCVTHLYGSNAIRQVETVMHKFVLRIV